MWNTIPIGYIRPYMTHGEVICFLEIFILNTNRSIKHQCHIHWSCKRLFKSFSCFSGLWFQINLRVFIIRTVEETQAGIYFIDQIITARYNFISDDKISAIFFKFSAFISVREMCKWQLGFKILVCLIVSDSNSNNLQI